MQERLKYNTIKNLLKSIVFRISGRFIQNTILHTFEKFCSLNVGAFTLEPPYNHVEEPSI
jgi:hypothetical protein